MSDRFWPAFKLVIKELLLGQTYIMYEKMEKEARANAELAEYQHKEHMKHIERRIRTGCNDLG